MIMFDKIGSMMKKHWFLLVLAAAVLILSAVVNDSGYGGPMPYAELSAGKSDAASARLGMVSPPVYYDDFAPEVQERQIERDAYVSLEIKRGRFDNAQQQLKELIQATDSLLLYENVNAYADTSYGSYNVKVKAERYSFFLTQIREIGKVLSLTDNGRDVTGQMVNLQEQIDQAKQELARLKSLLKETKEEKTRVELQQQLSQQEQYLNDLQKQLENQGDRIEYFTVGVNLQEAHSSYQGVEFINFSELIRKLVISFNALLRWLFGVLPWAVLALIVWLIVRAVKRRA